MMAEVYLEHKSGRRSRRDVLVKQFVQFTGLDSIIAVLLDFQSLLLHQEQRLCGPSQVIISDRRGSIDQVTEGERTLCICPLTWKNYWQFWLWGGLQERETSPWAENRASDQVPRFSSAASVIKRVLKLFWRISSSAKNWLSGLICINPTPVIHKICFNSESPRLSLLLNIAHGWMDGLCISLSGKVVWFGFSLTCYTLSQNQKCGQLECGFCIVGGNNKSNNDPFYHHYKL